MITFGGGPDDFDEERFMELFDRMLNQQKQESGCGRVMDLGDSIQVVLEMSPTYAEENISISLGNRGTMKITAEFGGIEEHHEIEVPDRASVTQATITNYNNGVLTVEMPSGEEFEEVN